MRRFLFVFLFSILFLCFVAPSARSFSLVQAKGATGDLSVQVAFTSNSAGNLIIVSAAWLNGGTVSSVTDSNHNAYVTAVPQTTSTNGLASQIWYAANIAGGANTVTVNFTTSFHNVVNIFEYSGLATASPLDVTHANTGTGTAVDTGSLTTTQANELIFASGYGTGQLTAGTNYTFELQTAYQTGEYLEGEDRAVSAAGTYNATFSNAGNWDWVAQIATFKAASTSASLPCGEPVATGSAAPQRLPSNYTTLSSPTQGAFTDGDFNTTTPCNYYRLSTGDNVSPPAKFVPTYHSYIYSPFSCDDNLELVGSPTFNTKIINLPSGTTYQTVTFSDNNSQPLWAHCGHGIDNIDSKVLYYHDAAGPKLYRYHADTNVTDLIHNFSTDGYTSICFGCDPNGPHAGMQNNVDDTIGILAQRTDGSWDSFVYDMRNAVRITTTPVHSATRPEANQSLPTHRLLVAVMAANCSWSLYRADGTFDHTLPAITNSANPDCPHSMAGIDSAGNEVLYYAAVGDDASPCQFGHGPGIAKVNVDTGVKTCIADIGWAGAHISISQDGKWIATETEDGNSQENGCTNAYYQANPSLNWQQYFTRPPGLSLYAQELDLAATDGSTTYRLAHHRSRGMDNSTCSGGVDGTSYDYYSEPRNAISYSGKWIAFDSNYGTTSYPTTGPATYADTYAVLTGLVP